MAWQSNDGLQWDRILDREKDAHAYGVSTDGNGSVLIAGTRDDNEPLVWEPRRQGGFDVTELPTEDGVATQAIQVARAFNSYMVIGNAYPHGPDGDTKPVAWLKVQDETDWLMIEPPTDADEFIDVADSSVFGDGTVDLARMMGQQFVGDRFAVLGYREGDFHPAIWSYTLDGKWVRSDLSEMSGTDEPQQLISSQVAISHAWIWNKRGSKWVASRLPDSLGGAYAGALLDFSASSGLMLVGTHWNESGDAYYPVFIYSAEGGDWTELPNQPPYNDLLDSLAAMEDHVVAISEESIYLGPIPPR